MSSDQPYTPGDEDMENRYVLHSLSLMDFPRGDREEWAEKLRAEFQRGLARVRRDAAREALRDAAGIAVDHAIMCPTGCRTEACAAHNRTTAAWLRDLADDYPKETP